MSRWDIQEDGRLVQDKILLNVLFAPAGIDGGRSIMTGLSQKANHLRRFLIKEKQLLI